MITTNLFLIAFIAWIVAVAIHEYRKVRMTKRAFKVGDKIELDSMLSTVHFEVLRVDNENEYYFVRSSLGVIMRITFENEHNYRKIKTNGRTATA